MLRKWASDTKLDIWMKRKCLFENSMAYDIGEGRLLTAVFLRCSFPLFCDCSASYPASWIGVYVSEQLFKVLRRFVVYSNLVRAAFICLKNLCCKLLSFHTRIRLWNSKLGMSLYKLTSSSFLEERFNLILNNQIKR